MKSKIVLCAAAFVCIAAALTSCNGDAANEASPTQVASATTENGPAVTNPNFSIAPIEYVELSEKAFKHFEKFEYDQWAEMMADDIVYAFPDGDVTSRTQLKGKAAVLAWWKAWKEKSGITSITLSEFNNMPINVTAPPKGGAAQGIYVLSYFSSNMLFGNKPANLRMNYSIHFNADKKIDRYTCYYDRSVIMKATGRNMLEELKTN